MIESPKRALIPLVTLIGLPAMWLILDHVDEDGFFVFFLALPLLVLAGIAHIVGFLFAGAMLLSSLGHIRYSKGAIAGTILMLLLAAGNGAFAVMLYLWMFT